MPSDMLRNSVYSGLGNEALTIFGGLKHRAWAAQRVLREAFGDQLIGLVHRVRYVEQLGILGADGAVADQRVEVHHLVPELGAEQDQRHTLLHLASLHQRQDLEELVEGAVAAWEQHHRLGEVDEPELPHEEVMEMHVELAAHIGIVELLVGDRDGETDIESPGL